MHHIPFNEQKVCTSSLQLSAFAKSDYPENALAGNRAMMHIAPQGSEKRIVGMLTMKS